MIQLRTLGTLALRNTAGEDLHSVLAQPKRVALLVYLAIARPRGFHRRDTLLALLWPEQDEQHARWGLNQALRQLRSALGKEVLPSRGDEEVGVDVQTLTCDAVEFQAAVDSNDLARALELYQGDLLEGFHVSGCGDFERWLEEERVWLRRRAARAAALLASSEEARGERVAAGHWARRAFALAADDESEVRNLIAVLDRLGDRAGAIEAYESFARRLRDEYEVEPAPETVATIEAVRRRQLCAGPAVNGAEPQEPASHSGPSPSAARLQPNWPRRRYPPVYLGLGAGLLVAVGAAVWGLRPPVPMPSGPDLPGISVAVLPFSYQGSPKLAYVGEGMADLLSTSLNGAGEIRTLDPLLVIAFARRMKPPLPELERAEKVRTQLRAEAIVLGSVVEAGGRLRITARLRGDPRPGAIPIAASVEGVPAHLFRLVDDLTSRLIAGTSRSPIASLSRLAALTTDSLGALKAYLEGERHFRAGRMDSTMQALERAIRIDSSFALAHYRKASAAMWTHRRDLADDAADRALALAYRLSEPDRRLIRALSASLHGRIPEAARLYREILTRQPENVEASYQLGDLIFHHPREVGVSWLDAREHFERVLSIDPYHQGSLYHLSNIAARERTRLQLDSLTTRLLEIVPLQAAWFYRAQRAIVFGDTAEVTRYMTELRRFSDDVAQPTAGFVVGTTGDLAIGRRLWRLMTEPSRSRGVRVLAHLTLAKIEVMTGRWRAAQAELDSARMLDPETALEHRALLSLWPLLQVPRSELVDIRNSLLKWKGDPEPAGETTLGVEHAPAHPYLRLYLLGLLGVRLGAYDDTRRYAAELTRRARTAFAPSFVEQLGRTLRAELARGDGRLDEALTILDSLSFWTPQELELTGDSPFYGYEYESIMQAELLYASGRFGDALRAYRIMADALFHSGAPAHLRMGQIYERQGKRQKALQHYARFVELWKDCDPELRPILEDARRRIQGSSQKL